MWNGLGVSSTKNTIEDEKTRPKSRLRTFLARSG
jgi:hypothetical protein